MRIYSAVLLGLSLSLFLFPSHDASPSLVSVSRSDLMAIESEESVFLIGLPYRIQLSPGNQTFFSFDLWKNKTYAVLLGGNYIKSFRDLDISIFDENLTKMESVNTLPGEMTIIPSYVPEMDGTHHFVIENNHSGDDMALASLVVAPVANSGEFLINLGNEGNNSAKKPFYTFAIRVSSHSSEQLEVKLEALDSVAAEVRLYPFTLVEDQEKFDPLASEGGSSFTSARADKKGENLTCSMVLGHRKNDPVPEDWILVTVHMLFGEGNATLSVSFEEDPENWERWVIHGGIIVFTLLIFVLTAVWGEKYIR